MKLLTMLATLPLAVRSATSSCTVEKWGNIGLEHGKTATINLGTSSTYPAAHVGLHIPAFKYNYASCVANDKVEIKAYKYSVSKKSCVAKPISTVTFDKKSFSAIGQKKTQLTTGIKIDGVNLAALQTSDGKADQTNSVQICLKASIKLQNRELLFREDVVTVSYKPKLAFNGATAATVFVSRRHAEDLVVDADTIGGLTAFRCDKDLVAYVPGSEPVIDQANPLVRICVRGETQKVQCEKFWDATLKQDLTNGKLGAPSENRVADGAIKSIYDGTISLAGKQDVGPKNARHKGCVLVALLPANYFQSTTPGSVKVTGEVYMSFKAARGRRLRDDRELQDEEALASDKQTASTFDIDVPLERPMTNTAARTSFIAAGLVMAATAAVQFLI